MATGFSVFPDMITRFDNCFDNINRVQDLIYASNRWEPWESSSNDFVYGSRLLVSEDDGELYAVLKNAIGIASSKYKEIHPIPEQDLGNMKNSMMNAIFRINRYNSEVGMGPHVDRDDYNENAYYVVVTYLNDDYDDGEIFFIKSETKIKPKAGDILIFPGNLQHMVFPVMNGKKMIITHHLNGNFKDM
jgi:hypothetical protein